jgi:outer membrane lipoprotein-sorting protein
MRKLSIFLIGLLLVGTVAACEMCIGEKSTSPLSDILDKGKGITSVKYDMVISSPGVPATTQKVWMKGDDKMRMEMTAGGQTVITIRNGDTMYMYYPEQNMAMKTDIRKATKSAVEEVGSIGKYKPKVIGTETMDGKLCTVVEYVTPEGRTKMWIWQKHGFPVRVETAVPNGTMVMEYKNISFGNIPDSMFKLPAGVKIMDMSGWG